VHIGSSASLLKQSALFEELPDVFYSADTHGVLMPAPAPAKPASPAMRAAPPVPASENPYERILRESSPEMKETFKMLNSIDDGKQAIRLFGIDFQKELDTWLATRKSDYTRRSYSAWVKVFTDYCKAHDKNPCLFRINDARAFYSYLENELSFSKPHIRLIMSACKGLYDSILENNETLTMRNPFDAKNLHPKKERVKTLHVPTQEELDVLIEHAKVCNRGKKNPLIYTALVIIRHYGLRVGALPTMEFDGTRVRVHSKAHDLTLTMSREDIALIKAMPRSFSSYSVRSLTILIDRYLTDCFKKKLVRFQYSAHDIRHSFAVDTYEKSGKDVIAVKQALGHNALTSTATYLSSLEHEKLIDP
jgi:site-specific recombinase XerD